MATTYELGYPWVNYSLDTNRYDKDESIYRAAVWHRKYDSTEVTLNTNILKTTTYKKLTEIELCFVECLGFDGACLYVDLSRVYFGGQIVCKLKGRN